MGEGVGDGTESHEDAGCAEYERGDRIAGNFVGAGCLAIFASEDKDRYRGREEEYPDDGGRVDDRIYEGTSQQYDRCAESALGDECPDGCAGAFVPCSEAAKDGVVGAHGV